MPRREDDPSFIEAIARGLDVIRAFDARRPAMSLSEVAAATQLARPTARRILRTLELLGYVRQGDEGFTLTPRVLELGHAYVQALGLWDIARPHMRALVAQQAGLIGNECDFDCEVHDGRWLGNVVNITSQPLASERILAARTYLPTRG